MVSDELAGSRSYPAPDRYPRDPPQRARSSMAEGWSSTGEARSLSDASLAARGDELRTERTARPGSIAGRYALRAHAGGGPPFEGAW